MTNAPLFHPRVNRNHVMKYSNIFIRLNALELATVRSSVYIIDFRSFYTLDHLTFPLHLFIIPIDLKVIYMPIKE